MNRADRGQQLFAQGAFQEVAAGARFERAHHLSVARARREDDDSRLGFVRANRLKGTYGIIDS
jgi:hypothetical protein